MNQTAIIQFPSGFVMEVTNMWDRHPSLAKKSIVASNESIKKLRMNYGSKDYNSQIFSEIGIETINRCNGKCSFCPVSVQNEKRSLLRMSDEIWEKIINQLKDIKFAGTIFPYINNEILLDKKIFDRLAYARKVLGENINICIETNGKLLVQKNNKGIKIIEKMAKYANQVLINDYADNEECYNNFNPRIRHILNNLNLISLERDFDLKVCHRLETQLLNNRFGMVEGLGNQKIPKDEAFCDFPFFQTNINPNGDVFICCKDSYYQEVIGNINKDTISEIWFGKRYSEIRGAFIENKRICDVCKKCTSSGTLTY